SSPTASVFPNPTSGQLNVSLSAFANQQVSIQVFNSNGQPQRAFDLGRIDRANERIDLSGLPAGMYLLQVSSPGEAPIIKKVMVQPRP
ncbi:MAG: T9SS type A sorting domain-containing protein, partial [Bacteroidota bacterium]